MTVFEQLQKDFPVRSNASEKEAFRNAVIQMAKDAGKTARVEENERYANIVIGDAEHADILFTAHYDTPRK